MKTLKELTPEDHEPEWSRALAIEMNGRAEERTLYGSRCDILTDYYAIEVEKSAKKWAEQIGQSLFYAVALGRDPAVILLVDDKKEEQIYIGRCAIACAAAGIKLGWINMNDPEEQLENVRTILRAGALPSSPAKEDEA